MQTLPKIQAMGHKNEHRRSADGDEVTSKEVEGVKPQITHNDCNFQNHVIDAVKKAVGLMSIDTPENNINAHVQLNLKLELECGLDGDWVISQTELQKPEPTQFHLKHTKPKTQLVMPSGSTSRPVKASQRRIRKFRL